MGTKNPLHTPICDLLHCDYPILQAGMGGVARAELVAAVVQAGGYGFLGMVRETPELIAGEIKAVRARTNGMFGVNLIPSATDPALFEAELAVCLEHHVHSLCFFWDVVPDAIARAKAADCLVVYQVGSVRDAIAAEEAGADIIIAQGVEAGGHVRGTVSSLVLLPQIVDAVSVPVVASGGFASGESLVAALALGAQGIHCGTAFLATEESFAHSYHKRQIVCAESEDTVYTDAFSINWPPNSPVRVLRNCITEDLGFHLTGHNPDDIRRVEIAREGDRPIYRYSTDSPLKNMTGNIEELALFAGQVAGSIGNITTAKDRIDTIMQSAHRTMKRMGLSAAPRFTWQWA